MYHCKEKIKDLHNVLYLSGSKENIKEDVNIHIVELEQTGHPCCVITYDEICDNIIGNISRSSDLNPFSNIDVKGFNISLDFLTDFIICLIELNYNKTLTKDEYEIFRIICSEIDLKPEAVPLFELLKLVQDRTQFRDVLTNFTRKIDVTVESIKDNHIFYSECNDRVILFSNLVNTLLSIQDDDTDCVFFVFTDILKYIMDCPRVLSLLEDLSMSEKMHIGYYLTDYPSINVIDRLNISHIVVLDSINNYVKAKKDFHVLPWDWVTCKPIKTHLSIK